MAHSEDSVNLRASLSKICSGAFGLRDTGLRDRRLVCVRILAICGSLQAQSANLMLLHAAARSASAGVEIVSFDGLRHLPHFDPDLERGGEPLIVREWRRAFAESDAALIASPEYGHSLPGALKRSYSVVNLGA
jgi:NAD(P)H-dependent FMN reductase